MELQVSVDRSLQALNEAVEKLQKSVESQTEKVAQLFNSAGGERNADKMELGEIRREVQSVKGLLLSSNRFPSNPPVTPATLPAWQLEDKPKKVETSSNNSDDNSNNSTSSPELVG